MLCIKLASLKAFKADPNSLGLEIRLQIIFVIQLPLSVW